MPTRNVPIREHPSPLRAPPRSPVRAAFKFPSDQHLLITTQKEVLTWDQRGVRPIFESGSNGILAAREAHDGSGVLAIADDHVVVLHDLRQALNRSYRLRGTDGKVRLLEYSSDSQNIFFTTTLQNAVQIYSLKQSALLAPLSELPAPPTALGLSPTSHLLLTASESPAAIYIHNLILKTPPQLLQPRSSASPVDVITFHPERANIFLLGFRDGTLTAYDASRLPVARGVKHHRHTGEISSFQKLHTVIGRQERSIASEGGEGFVRRTVAITGAAFIRGYQTRAVSIGRDGKARILDFDLGGKILRTWHVKAPATTLSVYQTKPLSPVADSPGKRKAGSRPASQASYAQSTASEHIIAIGRQDGKVLLFNAIGLLLQEMVVESDSKPVLGVHWTRGMTKNPSLGSKDVSRVQGKATSKTTSNATSKASSKAPSEAPSEAPSKVPSATSRTPGSQEGKLASKVPSPEPQATFEPESVSALDEFLANEEDWTTVPTEEITPLEMEAEANDEASIDDDISGTVNFTPLNGTVERQVPQVSTANYMDLFSPVKPEQAIEPPVSPKRNARRIRPRLRSSTFVDKRSREFDSALQSSLGSAPSDLASEGPEVAEIAAAAATSSKGETTPQAESADAWETTEEASPATAKQSSAWYTTEEASPLNPTKDSTDTLMALQNTTNPPKLTIRRTPKARRKQRPSGHARMPGAWMASDLSLLPRTETLPSAEVQRFDGVRRHQTDGSGARKIGNIAMLAPYINRPRRSSRASNKSIDSLVKPRPIPSPKLHKQLDLEEDIWCTSTDASPSSSTRPSRKSRRAQHIHSHLNSEVQSPSLQSDGTSDVPFRSPTFFLGVHHPLCSKAPPQRPAPHPLHNARPHHPCSPKSPASPFTGSPRSSLATKSPPSASKPKKISPSRLGPGAARCDPLSMHEWFPRGSSYAATTSRRSGSRVAKDDFGTPLRRRLLPNQSPGPPTHDSPISSASSPSPLSEISSRNTPSLTSIFERKDTTNMSTPPLCEHGACAEMRDEMVRMRQDIERMKLEMKELRDMLRPRSKGGLGFGKGNSRGKEVGDMMNGVPRVE